MKHKAKFNLSCAGHTFVKGQLYPSPLPPEVDPSNFEDVAEKEPKAAPAPAPAAEAGAESDAAGNAGTGADAEAPKEEKKPEKKRRK